MPNAITPALGLRQVREAGRSWTGEMQEDTWRLSDDSMPASAAPPTSTVAVPQAGASNQPLSAGAYPESSTMAFSPEVERESQLPVVPPDPGADSYPAAAGSGDPTVAVAAASLVASSPGQAIDGPLDLQDAVVFPTILPSPGGVIFGNIATVGELDWYSVNLLAGLPYTFSLKGSDTGNGTLLDPYLTLYSATGSSLISSDDDGIGKNSLITFTPTTTGTYLLAASAFGSGTGTYKLISFSDDASPATSLAPAGSNNIVNATTHGYSWSLGSTRTVTWGLADSGTWHWTNAQQSADQIQKIFDSVAAIANIKFEYSGYFTGSSGLTNAGAAGVDISIAFDSAFFNSPNIWGMSNFPSTGQQYNPYPYGAGDILLNPLSAANDLSYEPGTAGYLLILHELGHSLGLKHPHDNGGTGRPTFAQAGISSDLDIDWGTVMSYRDDYPWDLRSFDPATPMLLDVTALQSLYGPNTTTNAGDSNHRLVVNQMYQTIWDASGNDTVDASLSSFGWNIYLSANNLNAGVAERADEVLLSRPTTLYWLMGGIENVNGSDQNDEIHGSASDNVLRGNGGDDLLEGGAGNDIMYGGDGDDRFDWDFSTDFISAVRSGNDIMYGGRGNDVYVISGLDQVIEYSGEGIDLVWVETSWSLMGLDFVENLSAFGSAPVNLTGNNNSFGNVIRGNDANNLIDGGDGNDTMYGGGGNDTFDSNPGLRGGNDIMFGGPGDDTYYMAGLDTIVENDGEGYDTVWVPGSYSLMNLLYVEALRYYGGSPGALEGNGLANYLTGGVSNDLLDGGAGDDTLDGGFGADRLIGGTGNDTYLVDNSGDLIVEAFNAGNDTVLSSVTFYLPDNVENLTLVVGSGNLTASGNGSNNTLIGNEGNNILLGQGGDDVLRGGAGNDILAGGAGNDTLDGGTGANEMIGGTGNDTYIVTATTPLEAALQTIYEAAGEGTDEVFVTASVFALEWYGSSELENLTLADSASHAAIIGNALNNRITGGAGADALFGRAGNDILIGGDGIANTLIGNEGDDTYVVSAVGDSVIEFAGQGTDTVITGLSSFTLRNNVENLTYTGTGSFTGIGSSDGNRMTGGAGNDFLSGLDGADVLIGGSGSDTLIGGNGADQFRFRATDTGLDRILDFTPGVDQLVLSGFTHTPLFGLVQTSIPSRMGNGSTFLYDSSTGIVSFDADGVGSAVAVNIAQLNPGLTLTIFDFMFDDTVQASASDRVGGLDVGLPNDPSGSETAAGNASSPDPLIAGDPLPASTGALPEATADEVAPRSTTLLDLAKLDPAAGWLYARPASDGTLVARFDDLSDARPNSPSSADDGSFPHAAADDILFGDAIGLVGIVAASTAWHEIPLAHGMS